MLKLQGLALFILTTLTGTSVALPIMYCPGNEPCYEVCECPENVNACGEDNPPPCCLGSEPCAVAAAANVTSYTDLVGSDPDAPIDETITVVPTHEGTAVLSLFRGGELLRQKVFNIEGPMRPLNIDLGELGDGADMFRLYVDQTPEQGRRRFTILPTVFHKVSARREASDEQRAAIQHRLGGVLEKTTRVPPDAEGPTMRAGRQNPR